MDILALRLILRLITPKEKFIWKTFTFYNASSDHQRSFKIFPYINLFIVDSVLFNINSWQVDVLQLHDIGTYMRALLNKRVPNKSQKLEICNNKKIGNNIFELRILRSICSGISSYRTPFSGAIQRITLKLTRPVSDIVRFIYSPTDGRLYNFSTLRQCSYWTVDGRKSVMFKEMKACDF